MIRIVGVGDIMPGGLLNVSRKPCANDDVLHLLMDGDVRCGTLECALGNEPTYDEAKVADRGNVIYAMNDDIRRLKELHIDIVSLANNHFYDLGPNGAAHTIELLDKENILHCGAGRNLEEAGRPVVMEFGGKTVAFLAFCDTDYNNVYYCTYATADSPGVNPMTCDYVEAEIKKCAALYDFVVVIAHWGREHTFYPNVTTRKMSELMLKAGACLVLGGHPHRVQPIVNTGKTCVAYSMGNFLFPERLIAPPKVTYYADDDIDYDTLPVTDEYPIVDRVTLKTLPFWARVGMIVTADLDGCRVSSRYHLTYLEKDNTVTMLDKERGKEANRIVSKLSWLLKYRLYRPYMLARRILISVRRRMSRILQ
ncbi:MAG: CapA family protein [Bacteroidaceae bacterium]|nr:CapA family protein [Bacteroidaceae bacterium]